jgi:branched-chain amino acid transport system substrate-binding protein
MKRAFPQTLISMFFLASTVCSIGCGGGSNDSDEGAIRIGALLDLSGPGRDLGNLSKGAIEQAIDEAAGRGKSISLRVVDTGSDPARAAEGLTLLVDAGITTVIGPQTSSEARQILPIANASGVLIVSTGSTASALSIAKDSLYRLVPTDVVESSAVYELMRARGDSSFVTVGREDTGNQGLVSSLRTYATAGGYATQPGISYPTTQIDSFQGVSAQVANAISLGSRKGRVGVFVAGFDEVANLLAAIGEESGTANVSFYGGDGSAQVDSIVSNSAAASFAYQADGFPSALTTIPSDSLGEAQRVTDAIGGTEPNAFALGAYDAVGILEKAYELVGPATWTLMDRFSRAAEGYQGVTGTILLDASGDRISAPYAFWGVCPGVDGEGYRWVRIGSWVPTSASSQRGVASFSGCP